MIRFASVPIKFNPNAPLAFGVTVADRGRVFPKLGIAILYGKLLCNRAANIQIAGRLSQIVGRAIFRTDYFSEATCPDAGVFPYQRVVPPDNGLFGEGKAKAVFEAFGIAGDSVFFTPQKTQNLTLARGASPASVPTSAATMTANRASAAQHRAAWSSTHCSETTR